MFRPSPGLLFSNRNHWKVLSYLQVPKTVHCCQMIFQVTTIQIAPISRDTSSICHNVVVQAASCRPGCQLPELSVDQKQKWPKGKIRQGNIIQGEGSDSFAWYPHVLSCLTVRCAHLYAIPFCNHAAHKCFT